jgi:hypothetical protein
MRCLRQQSRESAIKLRCRYSLLATVKSCILSSGRRRLSLRRALDKMAHQSFRACAIDIARPINAEPDRQH